MDFFRETQRYLAQFHNAHTEFIDTTIYTSGDIAFGLYARLIDDKWVITASTHAEVNQVTSYVASKISARTISCGPTTT